MLETTSKLDEYKAMRPAIQRAHELATRDALLEHARMGRPVYWSVDGKIVEVSPAEVFARYGLDEFGRPPPDGQNPGERPV